MFAELSNGGADFENDSNGDEPALGRELVIAELLSFMKRKQFKNAVWLTADLVLEVRRHCG